MLLGTIMISLRIVRPVGYVNIMKCVESMRFKDSFTTSTALLYCFNSSSLEEHVWSSSENIFNPLEYCPLPDSSAHVAP